MPRGRNGVLYHEGRGLFKLWVVKDEVLCAEGEEGTPLDEGPAREYSARRKAEQGRAR